jgi:hypothetical protein
MKDDPIDPDNGYNEFAEKHGGPVQNAYQLFREDVEPCRWYLGVNGHEPQLISSAELGTQLRFRNWHFDHSHRPPRSTDRSTFEERIERLYDNALPYNGTLPFLQTDAGLVEALTQAFEGRMMGGYRAWGQEFLDGKQGDNVRVKMDVGRIYFKWKWMNDYCQRVLNMREKDMGALKRFISRKGGYQGEQGARDWWRWTYWVPIKLFEGSTWERWFGDENGK